MATESGIINESFSQDTGTILRDNGFDPNPVFYNDPTLTTRGINLVVGDCITYDIDNQNAVTNVTPCILAPIVKVCDFISIGCDYCYTLSLVYADIINISAGLTPATSPYIWITDKFYNQYSGQVTIQGDGSFDLVLSDILEGLLNPSFGIVNISITSDVDGLVIIPMTFEATEFNCLKLYTTCN